MLSHILVESMINVASFLAKIWWKFSFCVFKKKKKTLIMPAGTCKFHRALILGKGWPAFTWQDPRCVSTYLGWMERDSVWKSSWWRQRSDTRALHFVRLAGTKQDVIALQCHCSQDRGPASYKHWLTLHNPFEDPSPLPCHQGRLAWVKQVHREISGKDKIRSLKTSYWLCRPDGYFMG